MHHQSFFRSSWNQLITSLAVSDLMSAIISPVYVYSFTWGFETWKGPRVFCKVSLHLLWCVQVKCLNKRVAKSYLHTRNAAFEADSYRFHSFHFYRLLIQLMC